MTDPYDLRLGVIGAGQRGMLAAAAHRPGRGSRVTALRDIIARGEIGTPKTVWVRHFVGRGGDYYFKDWHADRRRTTGLLVQKAAHDIDVIHWLAGGYTERVNALATSCSTAGCPPPARRARRRSPRHAFAARGRHPVHRPAPGARAAGALRPDRKSVV